MNQSEAEKAPLDFNRREFLRGASFGTLMMLMGGVPLEAEDKPDTAPAADTGFSPISAPISLRE